MANTWRATPVNRLIVVLVLCAGIATGVAFAVGQRSPVTEVFVGATTEGPNTVNPTDRAVIDEAFRETLEAG